MGALRCCKLLLALGLAAQALPQEIDTVIFAERQKPFTILDQIENPKEREAFLTLSVVEELSARGVYKKRDARKRRDLAESFLASYPQSWLLAQVYEIAAKASMDLEDYPRALQYGRESVRLLPENPLLLVPLANVQVQQGLLSEAAQTAREALDCLDRFERPLSVPVKRWPAVERQLRASAYYALGRAATLEGLSAKGTTREGLLRQGEAFLIQARDLNPEDPEIAYLLGLTALALGKTRDAGVYFAGVYKTPGPLKVKALKKLKRIYEAMPSVSAANFQTFLVELTSQNDLPSVPAPSPQLRSNSAEYAGSRVCRTCHSRLHSAWQGTGMARMFRTYRPENVIGDFQKNNRFRDSGDLLARMIIDRGQHYFEIRGSDRRWKWKRYRVDYTIGSKWQQAYATRLPNGQIHVLPIQYNMLQRQWINFWKVIDTPGSERANVQGFSRLIPATNYQRNCAPCHTSQLRLTGTDGGPDNAVFREEGINCEMCHGPSAKHVAGMLSGKLYAKRPLDPPVSFRKISNREYVSICAQCHMQSAVRRPPRQGGINYSSEGDIFYPHYRSRNYADFSQKAFYKDGRFRETTFIVESFLRTDCFKRGQAHCGHCHNPHPPDASSNPKSLKFLDQPDRMCLQCHVRYSRDVEEHTHHPVSSEGSRCVSCHMLPIMNSLLFQARSHRIDDIPNAEMVLRFGRQESPNACLLCHSTKNGTWVKERLQVW